MRIAQPVASRGFQLATVFVLLVLLGTANLYSAGLNGDYWQTHLLYLIPAGVVFVLCALFVPLQHLQAWAYPFYALILMLHVLVLLVGDEAGGSQRWLSLSTLRFQPAEFAKLALILVTARFFAFHRRAASWRLRDLWLLIAMTVLLCMLIFRQPDLGTAGICLVIVCAQLFFVPLDKKSALLAISVALVGSLAAWQFLLHDYQKLRVLNLLNPALDPHGSGYNSLQSLIATGSGGFIGKGFLQGSQSQLHFLPARHTDFALAVLAEEHGFIGALLVLVLFAVFTWLGLQIAMRAAKDSFAALLAIGLTAKIFVEFAVNVAMIAGMFPVVGTPLPFFFFWRLVLARQQLCHWAADCHRPCRCLTPRRAVDALMADEHKMTS